MSRVRSRVGTTPDFYRWGEALRRPGMDTRTWVSIAYVQAVKVDPVDGPLADVLLMPSEDQETARIGAIYAGNGWGIYAPLYKDDEVIVSAPSGDPDHG